MAVIPFYGATDPGTFAIERQAMDRAGRVLAALDRRLPARGLVADVGAGDGFTAARLTGPGRRVLAVEPAAGMVRPNRDLPWVGADAEALPFANGALDAAYATWAYFLLEAPWEVAPGLAELHRVVRPGGPLLVVDNLGGDEFTALADRTISVTAEDWAAHGFGCEEVDTWFDFESHADARRLLGFFFGPRGERGARLRVGYRVGVFHASSRGPGGN